MREEEGDLRVSFQTTSYFCDVEYGMVKLGKNVIPPFNEEGDVFRWIKKAKLVARLQKMPDLGSFLPSFLQDVLALYLEMSYSGQLDKVMIKLRLMNTFLEGPFETYEKLKRVTSIGESVDIYANNIKRLVRLTGYLGAVIRNRLWWPLSIEFETSFSNIVNSSH